MLPVLLFILFLYPAAVCTETAVTAFVNFTVRDGLPSGTILQIFKDSKRFLWILTDAGFCRYDGTRFVQFDNSRFSETPGPETNFWRCMEINPGEITFFSGDYRIYTYFYKTGMFMDVSAEYPALKDFYISGIYTDGNGFIFYGNRSFRITDASFNLLKEYTIEPDTGDNPVHYRITGLYKDSLGRLWISTLAKGLHIITPGVDAKIRLSSPLRKKQIYGIYPNRDSSKIWIASMDAGVVEYSLKANSTRYFPGIVKSTSEIATSVFQPSDSIIWVGTNNGLAEYNTYTDALRCFNSIPGNPASIINDKITTLYYDDQEILWIGTYGGLSKLYLGRSAFSAFVHIPLHQNSLSTPAVNFIKETGSGTIWFGTEKGVDIYHSATASYFQNIPATGGSVVLPAVASFISSSGENQTFVGFWGKGIAAVQTVRKSYPYHAMQFRFLREYSSGLPQVPLLYAKDMLRDAAGYFLVSTWGDGLAKMTINHSDAAASGAIPVKTTLVEGLPRYIAHMAADSEGWVYISSTRGLFCYNPGKDSLIQVLVDSTNPAGLANSIGQISIAEDNSAYFGSASGIFSYSRKTSTLKKLFDNTPRIQFLGVQNVIEDKKLWFSCGQSAIGVLDLADLQVSIIEFSDIIRSFQISYGKAAAGSGGNIYFAGFSGALKINTHLVFSNRPAVTPYITEIFTDNVPYKTGSDPVLAGSLSFDYTQKDFRIAFSSMNFVSPRSVRYRYMLEGYSRGWSHANSVPYADFTNIPPGTYRFVVQCTDQYGKWNTAAAAVAITVLPPFWRTGWFQAAASLGFISVVVFVIYSAVKRVDKERRKQREFSTKLIEVQEHERLRVASELHDNISQNLSVLKSMFKFIPESDHNRDDLAEMKEILSEVIDDVRNVSNDLHPHTLQKLGLEKTINALMNKTMRTSSLNCKLEYRLPEGLISREKEITVFRIIQEITANAVKHSRADSFTCSLGAGEKNIYLDISDNGIGMDIGGKNENITPLKGFGMQTIHERVRILGGTLSLHTSPGSGTHYHISFPEG